MAKEYNELFGDLKSLYVEDVSPLDLKAQKIEEQTRQILEFKNQLAPVGADAADIDRDGEENDENDIYLRARRAAIARAIRKRRGLKEESDFVAEIDSPYDWRSTIDEDVQAAIDDLDADQITEKPVNNYAKGKTGKPVVKVNPNVDLKEEIKKMGGEVIYLDDNDDLINESIEYATDFFCEEGLSYENVENVIEMVGMDVFCEWLMGFAEDIELNEARTLVGKKKTAATGKERGISLKAAPGKTTKARVAKGGSTLVASGPANTVRKSLIQSKIKKAVSKVKEPKGLLPPAKEVQVSPTNISRELAKSRLPKGTQTTSSEKSSKGLLLPAAKAPKGLLSPAKQVQSRRPLGQEKIIKGAQDAYNNATSPENRQAVKNAIGNALKTTANVGARAILAGWQGHKAAMAAKGEKKGVASQLGRGAGAAISSFMKKGTSHLKEYIEYLLDEGYDLSEITLQEMLEDLEYIEEKAVSEQQQKLFGAALSVKRGQTPRSEVSSQVLEIVDSMSEKQIRDFAKTKHEGIPQKVDEEVTYEDILTFMNY